MVKILTPRTRQRRRMLKIEDLPPEILISIFCHICKDEQQPTICLASLSLTSKYFSSCLQPALFSRPIFLTDAVAQWPTTAPHRLPLIRFLNVWAVGKVTKKIINFLQQTSQLKALRFSVPKRKFLLPHHLLESLVTLTLSVIPPHGHNSVQNQHSIFDHVPNLCALRRLRSLQLDCGDAALPEDTMLESSLDALSLEIQSPYQINACHSFFAKSFETLVDLRIAEHVFKLTADFRTFIECFASNVERLDISVRAVKGLPHLPRLLWLAIQDDSESQCQTHMPKLLDIVPHIHGAKKLKTIRLRYVLLGNDFIPASFALQSFYISGWTGVVDPLRGLLQLSNGVLRSLSLHLVHHSVPEVLALVSNSLVELQLGTLMNVENIQGITRCPSLRTLEIHSSGLHYLQEIESYSDTGKTWSIEYLFLIGSHMDRYELDFILKARRNGMFPCLRKLWSPRCSYQDLEEEIQCDGFQISSRKERRIQWRKEVDSLLGLISKPKFGAEDFCAGF
ncbi:hypothetical protein BT69DRAFT_695284 [Atractiella rhizophila]|nr:hypothetical protein BT69DRAFT_695284 [Atractiella rhizophila]